MRLQPASGTAVRPGSDLGCDRRRASSTQILQRCPCRHGCSPTQPFEEVSMMSQMWKTGTLVAIALTAAATVAAQQPPPAAQQPPPTAPPAARADASDKVVVTGCIQRGIQSPVGTTGAPGAPAAADASKFILTKASPASDAAAAPKTYRLDADDSQLTAHV